jgi:hypothetical protein
MAIQVDPFVLKAFTIINSYGLGLEVCFNSELLLKLRIAFNIWQDSSNGWSARRNTFVYAGHHNTERRGQTSGPWAGFKHPRIQAAKTHAIDLATTETGQKVSLNKNYELFIASYTLRRINYVNVWYRFLVGFTFHLISTDYKRTGFVVSLLPLTTICQMLLPATLINVHRLRKKASFWPDLAVQSFLKFNSALWKCRISLN